ncbi:hypothetical protein [Marinobacterium stanieri]|uniref:hypothetical protein n=1 Tax=Marinobacterium stanieri TaxID=49186 RepID=UPI003A91CD43
MNVYTNTIADHIAYLATTMLRAAYRGDGLLLNGHELSYQQNDGQVICVALDDSHYPASKFSDIEHEVDMRPSEDLELPINPAEVHELVAALVRTELLRPDLNAQMRITTSDRTYSTITRLDISLTQNGNSQPIIDLQLQFDEHSSSSEMLIIARHYHLKLRDLCKPELCLLAEAAAALDPTKPDDLIVRIEKHLAVRSI